MSVHARRLNKVHDYSRLFIAAQRPGKLPVQLSERPWPIYSIHKPHLPYDGAHVYRGISSELLQGNRAS